MKQIKVIGGKPLSGTIKISGAKNSAVALLPASVLSDGIVEIENIPNISDIDALEEILTYLGAKVTRTENMMTIDSSTIENKEIPEEISKKLRASYYFMSALLGKFHKVEMYFPGGCAIGSRPIDQTLKGYKKLGASVKEEENKYIIEASKLKGGHIYLDMPSVGATINILLAATKALGETIIENAAKEPEIVNVATFLNQMGAKITGAGTSVIRITGVSTLKGGYSEVIPDRIEAGTYLIAGALVGDQLTLENVIPEHLDSLINKMKEMGIHMNIEPDSITISKAENLKPVKVKTLGYPGFPTDLQQPLTPLLTMCEGISKLEETVYENRFNNIPFLQEMGANIKIIENTIYVEGPSKLRGKKVMATDLRAGACLVLAGLVAEGETIIQNIEYILRGYENIVEKLQNVGAKIELEEI